jgi:hypothetical protein
MSPFIEVFAPDIELLYEDTVGSDIVQGRLRSLSTLFKNSYIFNEVL